MRICLSSLLLLCLCAPGALAGNAPSPTTRVQDSVGRVLDILRDPSLSRARRWEQIGEVINEGFDFRSMSQSILANNWRTASPEERAQFVEFFSQYLEEVYRERIESYTEETVEYLGETISGKRGHREDPDRHQLGQYPCALQNEAERRCLVCLRCGH